MQLSKKTVRAAGGAPWGPASGFVSLSSVGARWVSRSALGHLLAVRVGLYKHTRKIPRFFFPVESLQLPSEAVQGLTSSQHAHAGC